MEKLKPCPFCGAQFARYVFSLGSVVCDDCGARGTFAGDDRKTATERWNLRLPPRRVKKR